MDSNRVGLYASLETNWGENPSSPTMEQIRYTGETLAFNKQTVQSNNIRDDRMRDQVADVGQTTEGDINVEFAYGNFDKFIEGLMETTPVVITVNANIAVDGSLKTFTRATGSFVTDGVVVGMWLRTSGFTNNGNNGTFKVTAVTATVVTFGDATGLVTETSAARTMRVTKFFRNGTTPKSLLIEKRYLGMTPQQFFSFRGMRVGSMRMNVTAKEVVNGTFSFMGKSVVVAASTVAGSSNPAAASELITSSANVGQLTRNGVALSSAVRSIELTANNNLRVKDQVGSKDAAEIGRGFFEVTGTLEVYFENITLYNDLLNHATVALSFRLTDNAGNVVIFTLPAVKFTAGSPNAQGPNQDVLLPLEFSAIRDAATNCVMQIDMISAV